MLSARYPTKGDLKHALGRVLRYTETSAFGSEYHGDGEYAVVGPSPTIRKWYATVTVTNRVISKVR